MTLYEVISKSRDYDDFKNHQKFIDNVFNKEAFQYVEKEKENSKKYKKFTPITTKEKKQNKKDIWNTTPSDVKNSSPGYKGRENAKRRANIPHDKRVEHVDVCHYTQLPDDIKKIMSIAKKQQFPYQF